MAENAWFVVIRKVAGAVLGRLVMLGGRALHVLPADGAMRDVQ